MNSAVQFGLITLPGNPSTNSGLNIEAWDMQGKTLAYVQGILSSSGNWSIDEEGNLVVKKVTAQELCLDGVCIKKQQLEAILKLIGDNPSVLDAPIEVEPQVEEAVPVEVQIEEAPVVPLYYDEVVRLIRKNVVALGINPVNLLTLKKVKIQ